MSGQHILAAGQRVLTGQVANGVHQVHGVALLGQALGKAFIALLQRIVDQGDLDHVQILLVVDAVQIVAHPQAAQVTGGIGASAFPEGHTGLHIGDQLQVADVENGDALLLAGSEGVYQGLGEVGGNGQGVDAAGDQVFHGLDGGLCVGAAVGEDHFIAFLFGSSQEAFVHTDVVGHGHTGNAQADLDGLLAAFSGRGSCGIRGGGRGGGLSGLGAAGSHGKDHSQDQEDAHQFFHNVLLFCFYFSHFL